MHPQRRALGGVSPDVQAAAEWRLRLTADLDRARRRLRMVRLAEMPLPTGCVVVLRQIERRLAFIQEDIRSCTPQVFAAHWLPDLAFPSGLLHQRLAAIATILRRQPEPLPEQILIAALDLERLTH